MIIRKENHIYLVGFTGVGKTSLGKLISKMIGLPFVDMDSRIEKEMGIPIYEIFARYGESVFRSVETSVLVSISKLPEPALVATGNGTPLRKTNRGTLVSTGTVVYLKANSSTLIKRLKYSQNHDAHPSDSSELLLKGKHYRKRIQLLKRFREPYYESVANIAISTDDKSKRDIAREVIQRLASPMQ
jgi:shikimate kinase